MNEQKKIRVVAYIDGFNFYHSIAHNLPQKYKWMDYKAVVSKFLAENEEVTDIFLFTALPKWDTLKIQRHNTFMSVMVANWIRIINGNYTSVIKNFSASKHPVIDPVNAIVSPQRFKYSTFEEKQTDVNIALYILEWAMMDYYDKALIFSGDSDIAPSIHMARWHFPNKKFMCILPYKWKWRVIASSCDMSKTITFPILDSCLFPEIIKIWKQNIYSPYK